MAPHSDASVTLIYGRRGSGKSTYAKENFTQRVIAFDPQGEYPGAVVMAGDDITPLAKAAARDWASFRLAWRMGLSDDLADGKDYPEELHRLAKQVWRLQAGFGRDHNDQVTLLIDEANLSVPVERMVKGSRAIMELALQGRHRGINLVAVTQRPALISADLRGQASEVITFALAQPDDMAIMRKIMQSADVDRLASMPDHHYLRWTSKGEITQGKNSLGR